MQNVAQKRNAALHQLLASLTGSPTKHGISYAREWLIREAVDERIAASFAWQMDAFVQSLSTFGLRLGVLYVINDVAFHALRDRATAYGPSVALCDALGGHIVSIVANVAAFASTAAETEQIHRVVELWRTRGAFHPDVIAAIMRGASQPQLQQPPFQQPPFQQPPFQQQQQQQPPQYSQHSQYSQPPFQQQPQHSQHSQPPPLQWPPAQAQPPPPPPPPPGLPPPPMAEHHLSVGAMADAMKVSAATYDEPLDPRRIDPFHRATMEEGRLKVRVAELYRALERHAQGLA